MKTHKDGSLWIQMEKKIVSISDIISKLDCNNLSNGMIDDRKDEESHMIITNPYQVAIDCQDAINGAGVANLLVEVFGAIEGSTDERNTHPAIALILDKLISLSQRQCLCDGCMEMFKKDWEFCNNKSQEIKNKEMK